MNGYDNETQGMVYLTLDEAISALVAHMHRMPDDIERALNEIDCDLTDELMAIRVNAHLTGNWEAYFAYESARVSEYLLKIAKRDVANYNNNRCAQTADLFANRLSRDEE